jgi:type VI secretion system protein ImpK
LVFQEILTTIVRLRSNRQTVSNAQAFRNQMQAYVKQVERDGITKGYTPEDVRLATFAVVAFLDESILNSSNPAFSDWARMPMQEEMFGYHVAGEAFFENLERLLTRSDSHDVADLLEVYALCLLLGYKGKYGLTGPGGTRPVLDSVVNKIRRIRGGQGGLSPGWAIPEGGVVKGTPDAGGRRFLFMAAACVLLALLLYIGFQVLLSSGVSTLGEMARGI